ncbi:MAG: hypothetical protein J6T92_06325 [Ottowia sp.]|nr:hypothetical protein [Ottowia sp.]
MRAAYRAGHIPRLRIDLGVIQNHALLARQLPHKNLQTAPIAFRKRVIGQRGDTKNLREMLNDMAAEADLAELVRAEVCAQPQGVLTCVHTGRTP